VKEEHVTTELQTVNINYPLLIQYICDMVLPTESNWNESNYQYLNNADI
jgi:hypothetical protein